MITENEANILMMASVVAFYWYWMFAPEINKKLSYWKRRIIYLFSEEYTTDHSVLKNVHIVESIGVMTCYEDREMAKINGSWISVKAGEISSGDFVYIDKDSSDIKKYKRIEKSIKKEVCIDHMFNNGKVTSDWEMDYKTIGEIGDDVRDRYKVQLT